MRRGSSGTGLARAPSRRFAPEALWVEEGEERSDIVATVRSRFPEIPLRRFANVADLPRPDFQTAKRSLVLRRHRGGFLQHCPAGTSGLVCCNYLVVNFASNCPYDCSYCFLQDYLASNSHLTAFTNVDDGLAEIDRALSAHPDKQFRIGTGELADSLALDSATSLSRVLVPFFAARDNALLELKTKSDCIDDLLEMDPRGRVVVSWSVSPQAIADTEEYGTASLDERFAAARRVAAAGYQVGFHLDPIVEHEGWRAHYDAMFDQLFDRVSGDRIAWFSLGALRMTPALRRRVRQRPRQRAGPHALGAELVAGDDGKLRVWRGLRVRMYQALLARIRAAAPAATVYLCMEPPAVWQSAMKEIPSDRQLGMRLAAGARW